MKKAIFPLLLFSILLVNVAYAFPSVENVTVISGNGLNTTKSNLTAHYDAINSFVNTTDWRINNVSFPRLNMPFEANNGSESNYTLDRTTFLNNGTVFGANWSGTSGHDGKGAYFFDGVDDYINGGNSSSLESPNAWTVEFWANISSGGSFPVSIDRRGAGGNNFYIWRFGTGTWVVGFLKTTGGFQDLFFSTGVTVGAWQHFSFVFDDSANTMKYYRDGVLIATQPVTTSPDADGDQTLFIGVRGVGGDYYKGWLDDIRIYNRALSSAQVLADKNGYDFIAKQSLTAGQNWTACVTPNDGIQDGTTVCSSELQIIPSNLTCVEPEENLFLNNNTLFCSGDFDLVNGMIVNASNIIVGCNQTSIIGAGTNFGTGIGITSFNNVTVQSCIINSFENGLRLTSAQNNSIINNSFTSNTYNILIETSSSYNTISSNTFNLGFFGVRCTTSSNDNLYSQNSFFNTGLSIGLNSCHRNNIFNNYANASRLDLFASNNNSVTFNTINASLGDSSSITVQNSNFNTISNNVQKGGNRGLAFFGVANSYNIISYNSFLNNTDFGIKLSGVGNQVFNNNISNNNRKGLRLGEQFSSSSNMFVYNNIFLDNPIGIMITGLSNSTLLNNTYSNSGTEVNTTDGSGSTFIQTDSGSELMFQNAVILINNIDNIFISTAIVGLNTTLEPQMNTSANVTLHSSETGITCSNYALKTNPLYIKSVSTARSSILSSNCTGGQCSAVSCTGSTGNIDVTFNVPSFSTYFLDFTPPTSSQALTNFIVGIIVILYILFVGVIAYTLITAGGFGVANLITITIMLVLIPLIVELARNLLT